MNAASKTINQGNLFNGRFVDMHVSKELVFLLFLLLALLLSSISVIYTTNVYRLNCSQLQQLEQQQQKLKLLYGQLLLEEASFATPERIESLAKIKFNMRFPEDQDTYVLRSQ